MKEYVCRTATAADWQKWLRTWKHKYEIEILGMSTYESWLTVILTRKEL